MKDTLHSIAHKIKHIFTRFCGDFHHLHRIASIPMYLYYIILFSWQCSPFYPFFVCIEKCESRFQATTKFVGRKSNYWLGKMLHKRSTASDTHHTIDFTDKNWMQEKLPDMIYAALALALSLDSVLVCAAHISKLLSAMSVWNGNSREIQLHRKKIPITLNFVALHSRCTN